MRKTEYFHSMYLNQRYKVSEAIADVKRMRDNFIEKHKDTIEEILDEKLEITWSGERRDICSCLISLTYFEKNPV